MCELIRPGVGKCQRDLRTQKQTGQEAIDQDFDLRHVSVTNHFYNAIAAEAKSECVADDQRDDETELGLREFL